MVNRSVTILVSYLIAVSGLIGCSDLPSSEELPPGDRGTLRFEANGEDFVRQGFVSKDGWQMDFNHVYVTLAEVTAYQSDPAFNAELDSEIQAEQIIEFNPPQTVDLAAGDETAEPILVYEQTDVLPGTYNALSWKMVKAIAEPAKGHTIVLDGIAQKEGEKVNFTVNINQEYQYSCGEFVGDERKGIVMPGASSELEATFHFDHIFGDGSAPSDDPINQGALGFDPLASLASNGRLEIDQQALQQQLSEPDLKRLEKALISLGHVGEGHCRESAIAHQQH